MKKGFIIILAIFAVAVFAYPVFSWGPVGHMGGGFQRGPGYYGTGCGVGPRYGPCWTDNSWTKDLSQEDAAKLNELESKFQEETSALRSELWAKRDQLNLQLNSQNPDEKKVKELLDQVNTLRSKLAEKRTQFDLEARKIAPDSYGKGYERMHRGGYARGYGYGHGPCRY